MKKEIYKITQIGRILSIKDNIITANGSYNYFLGEVVSVFKVCNSVFKVCDSVFKVCNSVFKVCNSVFKEWVFITNHKRIINELKNFMIIIKLSNEMLETTYIVDISILEIKIKFKKYV